MEKAYTMAEEPYTRIYARIDLDAIVKNMEAMRENLPAKTKMIGVVKTDGYGHGAVPVAMTLLAARVRFSRAARTAPSSSRMRCS